jgi:hypothetical protein
MKFRKKPVVIEAIQWTGNNELQIMEFVGKHLQVSKPPYWIEYEMNVPDEGYNISIPTLEGAMKASRQDWIIKGLKGEFYPCKPDVFEMTYEPHGTPDYKEFWYEANEGGPKKKLDELWGKTKHDLLNGFTWQLQKLANPNWKIKHHGRT